MAERRSVAGRYVMPMEVLKRRPDEAVALGRLGALANALTSVAGWAATSVSTGIGRDRDAYTRLLTNPGAIYVGGRGTVTYVLGVLPLVVQFEIRENAVWRYGRVFLRCPRCSGRVTRILPTQFGCGAGLPPVLGAYLPVTNGRLQVERAVRLPGVVGRGCDGSGAGAQAGGVSQAMGGAAGFAVRAAPSHWFRARVGASISPVSSLRSDPIVGPTG